jgi:hypothetical protein
MSAERATLQDALEAVHARGMVFEIRALGARETVLAIGYFDDLQPAIEAAARLDEREDVRGVYVTLNMLKPACLARARNRCSRDVKAGSDNDIARRRWLLLDFDPARPAGISATDEELRAALATADFVRDALAALGWPPPIEAMSGNGAQLLYGVDLPNDAAAGQLVKKCLEALDLLFSDDTVMLDRSVWNASRLVRLYGTSNRKGDNVPDRPHRRSAIRCIPPERRIVSREMLEAVAATLPSESAPSAPDGSINVEAFINRHSIRVLRTGAWNGGRKYILARCPFDSSHTGTSVAVLQLASGAVVFKCFHNGCAGRTWRDVRELFQSNASDAGPASDAETNRCPSFTRVGDLLAENDNDDIEYVVDGLIPRGGTAVLAGRPKGGKSTIAANLGLDVERGCPFLGRATLKGPVLYLALEGARGGWKTLLRALGVSKEDDLYICIDRAPREAIDWLRSEIKRHRPVLVIIDTMQRLLRVKDGNDYATGSNAMDSAIELARSAGAALLFLHHSGKTRRDEIVDEVMGSTAWAAAVDTVLVLRSSERCHTIASEQRFGENLPETVVEMDPHTHRVYSAGVKADVDINAMRLAIIEFLLQYAKSHLDSPTADEPTIDGGVPGRTALKRKALREGFADGQISRAGSGTKGDPYRYSVSCSPVPDHNTEQGNDKSTAENETGVRLVLPPKTYVQ